MAFATAPPDAARCAHGCGIRRNTSQSRVRRAQSRVGPTCRHDRRMQHEFALCRVPCAVWSRLENEMACGSVWGRVPCRVCPGQLRAHGAAAPAARQLHGRSRAVHSAARAASNSKFFAVYVPKLPGAGANPCTAVACSIGARAARYLVGFVFHLATMSHEQILTPITVHAGSSFRSPTSGQQVN